jgi:hypothetical protein
MKEVEKLSNKLVFVDGYFLFINDDEIKDGDYYIAKSIIGIQIKKTTDFVNSDCKKIFAHLPHGDCKYLQGVHLLPSYCKSMNDVIVGFEYNGIINKDIVDGRTKIGGDWKFMDWIEYKKINQNNK